jgi:hypothetical protein
MPEMLEPHHLPQLLAQAQLGIGHKALPLAECGFYRLNNNAGFLPK